MRLAFQNCWKILGLGYAHFGCVMDTKKHNTHIMLLAHNGHYKTHINWDIIGILCLLVSIYTPKACTNKTHDFYTCITTRHKICVGHYASSSQKDGSGHGQTRKKKK